MSALSIQVPFPVFQDRDGQPLDNGYVWLGTSSLNPQTNPVVAYYDSALTIVATQPLRTLNGFISRAGSPAQVYVDAVNFSILVQDSKGTTVFSVPEGTGISPNASGVVYIQAGAGAVALTVQSKLRESVVASAKGFGAVGDNTTDDSAALNAMFVAGAGGTIELEPGKTYKCLSTLTIRGDATKIKGNGATINSYATGSAITFALVGGTRYPYNIDLQDLSLNAYGVGSYGLRVLTSYSTFRRVSVGIPAINVSGRGFALVGDETNGTGPYYNTFVNCDAQSGSSGLDHIGFSFMSVAPTFNRAPNANTFVGCRAASCFQNWNIKGNGNTLINPISECPSGTGTGFTFEATTVTNCIQNFIFGAYLEAPATGFYFSADAQNNVVSGAFGTGVTTWKNDLGTGNQVHTAIGSWSMPTGVNFPTRSADTNALDYYKREGTWTPVPTNVTVNSGTPVWVGKYTRIGNQVTANVKMTGGNITLNAGTSYVSLPFTAADVDWGVFGQNTTTARLGAVASYGAALYFADAATQSAIGASITFRV